MTFVQRSDTRGDGLCLDGTEIPFSTSDTAQREHEWESVCVVVFVWEMAGGYRWLRAGKQRLFKHPPTDLLPSLPQPPTDTFRVLGGKCKS